GGGSGGGKRRRIIIGEDGLIRRWGGVLFDTATGIGGFAKRGVKGAWNKLNQFGGWARGKIAGMGGGEGPGFLTRMRRLISGSVRGG
ncbi:hypothetical protein, partial [Salmonella enterica]|uniref:hypothetical protein n=1 Tax=Salmonella enterica TaxID=28901 RepID=UPI003EDC7D96